jgi:hypothetical protein
MVPKTAIRESIIALLLLVTVSFPASESAAASECQAKSRVFLSHPSKPSLTALSGLGEDACWTAFRSSNTNLDKLNKWVEQGNRWAAQYCIKHLKQLDGGNLEDALIALGKFSDHDMESLLFFAKEGLLSKHALADTLTMLPLSLSDNPRAELSFLSARKGKVMRVARQDLLEQKAQALTAIDDFVAEIKSKNPGNE